MNRVWLHRAIAASAFFTAHLAQYFSFAGREESVLYLPDGIILGCIWRFGYRPLPLRR